MFFDPWAAPDTAPVSEPPEPTIEEALFRRVSSLWLSGVAVVTARGEDGRPVGLTMSAVAPLSLRPPQYLICLSKQSSTLSVIRESGRFCLNILSEAQQELGRIFSTRNANKFDNLAYDANSSEPPELPHALARLQCTVRSLNPSGDHVVVVGDVRHATISAAQPLGYYQGRLGPMCAELGAPKSE